MKNRFILYAILMLIVTASISFAQTYYVSTTGDNLNDGSIANPWQTIQYAINTATPNSTIIVEAGTYPENLTINKALILQSASGSATTIISASSGTAVSITSDDVTIDGFTITNPMGLTGILASNRSDITIKNNIITQIGSGISNPGSNVFGISISGTSTALNNITIEDNEINTIHGGESLNRTRNATAIVIGFSTASSTVTNLLIQNNNISDIKAAFSPPNLRGAYGILINYGSSGTGNVNAPSILNNTIDDLEGHWAHGIGLETNTPNAVIEGNSFSNIIAAKTYDKYALFFEANPSIGTITVNNNNFNSTHGLGIHSTLLGTLTNEVLNAELNWWGNASGPSGTNLSGTGAMFGTDASNASIIAHVDYTPWLGAVVGTSPMTYYGDSSDEDFISEAINYAQDGDEIIIQPGVYNAFVVNKEITLKAEPGTIINHGSPAITVNADNVTLDGFTFSYVDPDYAIQVNNPFTGTVIVNCNFNVPNAVDNQSAALVMAEYNYWGFNGNPLGPTIISNPGGAGGVINENPGAVDYDPWVGKNVTPADGAIGIPVNAFNIDWDWLNFFGPNFDFELDHGGPQGEDVSTTVGTNSYTVSSPLLYNTTYNWYVRSQTDPLNNWIGPFSFTTLLGPPTLVSPSNNSININPNAVTLTWQSVPGVTHYRVTVSGPGAGGPYIVAAPNVSYTFGAPLAAGGVYDWYVEASNSGPGGPWSVPSPTWTFTTYYLTSPLHLQSGVSITPLFEWLAPATGTAPYTLEISTDPTFAAPVFTQSGINNEFYQLTIANKLDNATIYYWRVTATGGTVSSARFSTIFSAIPLLVSPQHLASIVGNTINFQWTMPASNLKYILEVDDNPNFLSPAIGFPTTFLTTNVYNHNYTLATLPANDYYWRVRVYTDTDILISVSSVWRFTISGPPTAIPAYPINLTTVYSNSPIIYWYLNNYYYNQGVYYRVRYGTNMGGPYNAGTSPITTNQWVPLPGLTIGQTYYYVIDASNSNTFGTYTTSEEGSFVVFYSAIAGIPVYQSYPLGNTVYTLTPTLYWFLGVHVPGVAFDIQVNNGPDFTSNLPLEVDVSGVAAYQFKTPVLTAGTSYTWRVRITGSTAWYGPETFYIDPGATPEPSPFDINIPTPTYPIGGAIVPTQSPVLTWSSSMGSGLDYQIIYSTNPTLDMNGVLVNVGPPNDANGGTSGWLVTNNYALSGLTPGVTYYWQVRSRLSNPPHTISNYSSVAQFTVAPGANPIVVLPANPIVGSTISTTAARLSWIVPAQSSSALTFELEVSNNPQMVGTTLIRNLEQPNFELTNLTPGTNYFWRVRSKTSNGVYSDYSYKGEFRTDGGVTSIEEETSQIIPSNYELSQNYPNPFNPTTMISFSLPNNSFVTLKVYDMLGREIRTLVSDYRTMGSYRVEWNGKDDNGNRVTSGTYIYRITADNFSQSKKMILLK